MKLDLGSGNSKRPGFISVDIHPFENVDVVHNIEKKLPFDSDYAERILMNHSLEHCSFMSIPNIMKECYRVLKNDGVLKIEVPCLECTMKLFLKTPEEGRWGRIIEYVYGNQGRSQIGDQQHKSGFTPASLKKYVENAGLSIISLDEYSNKSGMTCIRLQAKKVK